MSPDAFADQMAAAVAAVQIGPEPGYQWMGERVGLPAAVLALASARVVREALVQGIAHRLYGDFYICGEPRPTGPAAGAADRRRLSERLAAANAGTGPWDPGWRVVGHDDGRTIVERARLRLWVRADEMAHAGDATPPEGAEVAVLLAPDATYFSPGYYVALGDRSLHPQPAGVLDRFYVHVRCDGAERFMGRATARLNREGLAFRLKIVDDPDGFDRRDTAVFAFGRADRARALYEVTTLCAALSGGIDPGTPALTRRIAEGVAFAEDPGGGRSFGADRCRLVAEALVSAHEEGETSLDARVARVGERMRAAGTSLDAPYLGPGSPGDLDLTPYSTDDAEERSPCP
jgi:class II lanthipeptide synthase